jgi:hypothetical protein
MKTSTIAVWLSGVLAIVSGCSTIPDTYRPHTVGPVKHAGYNVRSLIFLENLSTNSIRSNGSASG